MKAKIVIAAALCLAVAGCVDRQPAPTEFTCKANHSWQNTGILVQPGDRLMVTYEGGEWTADIHDNLAPPAGNPHTPGQPGDVLPSANRSALIGRVGDQVFLIGNKFEEIVPVEGRLYCVINTNISTSSAAPFLPTSGSVTMRATLTRANPTCYSPIVGLCS